MLCLSNLLVSASEQLLEILELESSKTIKFMSHPVLKHFYDNDHNIIWLNGIVFLK